MRHSMRLAASVSFAFLLGSVLVSAQNASAGAAKLEGKSQSTNTVTSRPANSPITFQPVMSCPVSLRAQHAADGSIMKVDKNRPEGIAQLLHLILTSKDSREIVEARLRVRGVSPKGGVKHVDAGPAGADVMRNLAVRLSPSGENEVSADVWVPGVSAVLEVELNAVTFTDGGLMRFSPADGCRFTPEHLMLIANEDSR